MSEEKNKELEIIRDIGDFFGDIIKEQFSSNIVPSSYTTPTNIKHLDRLIGGGIVSSGPTLINSTPETGKTTFAFQFSKIFQEYHSSDGIVIYLDIEGSSSTQSENDIEISGRVSRIDSFRLDKQRFRYHGFCFLMEDIEELIKTVVDGKKQAEEQTGKDLKLLIVWDSIAATSSKRVQEADDPNKVIGVKARVLSHILEKINPYLKMDKLTFIATDQTRANVKIEGGMYKKQELTTGTFNDIKSATSAYALQHNTQQWLFFSKGKQFKKYGIDGWELNIFTEKNKYVPSQHAITCVFDKSRGIDKFYSEYLFLSDFTPIEKRIYKDKKPPFEFNIIKASTQKYKLVLYDDDYNPIYESESFFEKEAKDLYNKNSDFKDKFDQAVEFSCQKRITEGMFNYNITKECDHNLKDMGSTVDENVETI